MGNFYITTARLALNTFTTPVFSDQGLVLVAQGQQLSFDKYLAGQRAGTYNGVCVLQGSAYGSWLATNIPELILVTSVGSTGQVDDLVAGKCSAFSNSKQSAEVMVHTSA